MAIQKINLAVPGGDTPYNANTKINENFTNSDHAASRLVGPGADQLPTGRDVFAGLGSRYSHPSVTTLGSASTVDAKNLPAGTVYGDVRADTATGAPELKFGNTPWRVETYHNHPASPSNFIYQLAYPEYNGYGRGSPLFRLNGVGDTGGWRLIGQNPVTYNTTTASGANTVVTTTGELMRSTSSERYKDILAPLELDDARYADAMALKPIVYRSTADADNPAYHYYSFSAEELGAQDRAFTLWRETEMVTDADGNVSEQPLAERQAEGININALLAMGHAIAIKQGELIKNLQTQVGDLQSAVATLQATNNP